MPHGKKVVVMARRTFNLLQNQNIRRNFTVQEYACRCGCNSVMWNENFMDLLQQLRTTLNSPLVVISGYRCPAHNMAIGGAQESQHLHGRAVDVRLRVPTIQVVKLAEGLFNGIGYGTNMLHLDNRAVGRRRWWYRSAESGFTQEEREYLFHNGYVALR